MITIPFDLKPLNYDWQFSFQESLKRLRLLISQT
ncbi:unnamed protein product [Paramecium sonneborni]|uniref:Uncharacterized protein n=1 Tax=Paramecium sonneborni TaxID=65129 RepID=A0A8S1RGG0_9CILI|nr:unnamed protein product [Paramecium sonneborni]